MTSIRTSEQLVWIPGKPRNLSSKTITQRGVNITQAVESYTEEDGKITMLLENRPSTSAAFDVTAGALLRFPDGIGYDTWMHVTKCTVHTHADERDGGTRVVLIPVAQHRTPTPTR